MLRVIKAQENIIVQENIIKRVSINKKGEKMLRAILNFFKSKFSLRDKREALGIHGTFKLTGRDKLGNIVFVKNYKNLITNAGFDWVADIMGLNAQPSDITHMAIGDGVAGDATATTLTSEIDRQLAVYAHTPGTKTMTFTTTFADVVDATEYGCLNAAAAGTLVNIAGFAALTVDSLQIVVTFTLS